MWPVATDVMVTAAVSARLPPCCTAMTRKLPAVLPAVYSPPLVMLPPVALYVTAGAVVLPSLHTPLTANCCVAAVGGARSPA